VLSFVNADVIVEKNYFLGLTAMTAGNPNPRLRDLSKSS
jgi:hypothetical protein